MAKYKKIFVPARPAEPKPVPIYNDMSVLGMLYIASVRLVRKRSKETVKHRILLVGCEANDIERKLRWMFDASEYSSFSLTGVEKVREKAHFLSTQITQDAEEVGPVIVDGESGSKVVHQQSPMHTQDDYAPCLFAIGLMTTMLAKDQAHALRKVGKALIAQTTEGQSHSSATLSHDSTLTVEQVPLSDGFAKARDVSHEANRATFVRG